MNRTQCFAAMGNDCANIQWSYFSTNRDSGAVVCNAWHHANWFKEIDGRRYVIATYAIGENPRQGALPLLRAVQSGAPLYCVFMYPTATSLKIMDRYGPGKIPRDARLHARKYGNFVYELDRNDGFVDEYGNQWLRYVPGHTTLEQFRLGQRIKARRSQTAPGAFA